MTRILPRRGFLGVIAGLMCLGEAAAFQMERRRVQGTVMDRRGNPLKGAIVQITNTLSLELRSYIVNQQGCYHFAGLNSYVDYELKADYHGAMSPVKRVSQFDARPVVTIDLEVPTPVESAG